MKTKQILALIALLLGILGGVLLCLSFVNAIPRILEGRTQLGVEAIVNVVIGIVAILASVMIWKGSYVAGGIINIILGVVTIIYASDNSGLLILISGVLGVVAPQVKD
jgi:hypothetical protein